MSQAAKRVASSSINWQKLADRLTSQHLPELNRLKGQNSTFSAVYVLHEIIPHNCSFFSVNQLPADLPKIDFAALKKQLPAHASLLDSLQKQYEAISIPYGSIPEEYNKEVAKWNEYNEARIKLHELKTVDGAAEAKKVEEKWAKAPPVEHFDRQHFVEYFPQLFYDLRYQKRIREFYHFPRVVLI